jgi:hypothetical protein
MKVQLKLKTKPISTNSAYYKRNRSFNENTRKWRANFFKELQKSSNINSLEKFKKAFDPQKHMISVSFTWFQPFETLMTQSGQLSLRSMDVDNCLKIPTDCLFDSKYCTEWVSKTKGREAELYKDFSTLQNLDINDKFIFDTRSIKLPSNDGNFHCLIELSLAELPSRPSLVL